MLLLKVSSTARRQLITQKLPSITSPIRQFSVNEPTRSELDAMFDAYNRDVVRITETQYGTNEPRRNRVRVRYAPSPTGMMHIGGLRTFLYNYLFTK